MANPYLQAHAPGYQGAPTRKRPNEPNGKAYGWRGMKPPQAGPKPIPQLDGRPNPSPPAGIPGGAPGPQGAGGGMNQNGRPVAPLGADWGWRNMSQQQRNQQRQQGGNIPQLDGRPNPDGPRGIPGGSPGPVIGPGQGGGGQGGGGAGQDPSLPLDPIFEMQRRGYEDQLAAALGMLTPMREQIGAQQGLQSARLDTNEGVDQNRLMEQLNARGAYGGGIQNRDMGFLGTDYLRSRQDLANDTASQYGGIATQEGNARLQYMQQLQEALMAAAQRAAQDPNAAVGRQGNGDGGGGGWEPSWQPKNKRKAGGR